MSKVFANFGFSEKEWLLLQQILSSNPKVEKAILYGSRVKGCYKDFSDVDITLVGRSLSRVDLLGLKSSFTDSTFPYMVDLSLLSSLKNEDLIDHIKRRGVVVYEPVKS